MAPISSTRWPSAGRRPVVSVSNTISRMALLASLQACHGADEMAHLSLGPLGCAARIYDEMRAPTLVFVRELARKKCFKLGCGHTFASQRSRALDFRRRADHDDEVDLAFRPRFKQQGHVHNYKPPARGDGAVGELAARLFHRRMNELLKPFQGVRIVEDALGQFLAVDLPFPQNAGKKFLDGACGRA